jgi:hypothetical protein
MKKLVYLFVLLFSLSLVFASSVQYNFQDYDGDGITDRGVFFPSYGWWYVQLSGGGEISLEYGSAGDIPVPGNYLDKNKQCFIDSQCDDGWDCSIDVCGLNNSCIWDYTACECHLNSQCDDKNACTTDTCQNGACVQSNNKNSCDDKNACTFYDVCSEGSCSGIKKDCDDNWNCSIDSCNPLNGECIHTTTSCKCDTNERCDDGNVCTLNTCEGTCVTTNNNNTCDDKNACTLNDVCSSGSCSGKLKELDDGNLLTVDECLENGTVIHYTALDFSKYSDYKEETETDSSDNSGTFNPTGSGKTTDSTTSTDNTNSSSTNSNSKDTSKDGLSKWAIAAIWFFAIIIILGLGYFAYLYFYKRNNNTSNEQKGNTNKNPRPPGSVVPRRPTMPPRGPPMRRPVPFRGPQR